MSRITAHLVTWNGMRYIPHLFASLREQTFRNWELRVLDNGSSDGTVAAVERELASFPFPVRLEQNAENVGFAAGHNMLIATAAAPFVQLLNQDVVLAPDYFERVLAVMEAQPRVGAAQGALLRWDFAAFADGHGDGRTDIIDTLGLRVLRNRRVVEWMTGTEMSNVPPTADPPQADKCRPAPTAASGMSNVPIEVFGVSGALPMYNRVALLEVALPRLGVRGERMEKKLEFFDEDFFSYKEDVDLAFRLRFAGWSAILVPVARAWHDRTAAGPHELSDSAALDNRRIRSPLVRYHSYKNQIFVLIKNEQVGNFLLDWPWILWYELKKFLYLLIREPRTLRSLKDVWRLLPRMLAKRRLIMSQRKIKSAELRRWFR
ncbi:MAG: glycosyltransferase family 2 protein [Candidatus Uhrbacteria bacterium]